MNQRRNAFTLIELLVVVAIISLLVSILLPSLNKAKELARLVLCSSRLHSWSIAYNLYAGDNSGQMPRSALYNWPIQPGTTWYRHAYFTNDMHHNGHYMDRQELYSCPEVVRRHPPATDPMQYSGWVSSLGDYWWNKDPIFWNYRYGYIFCHRQGPAPPNHEFPYALDHSAGNMVLAGDATSALTSYKRSHIDSDGEITGGNFMFVDGHVSWYKESGLTELCFGDLHRLPYDRFTR